MMLTNVSQGGGTGWFSSRLRMRPLKKTLIRIRLKKPWMLIRHYKIHMIFYNFGLKILEYGARRVVFHADSVFFNLTIYQIDCKYTSVVDLIRIRAPEKKTWNRIQIS